MLQTHCCDHIVCVGGWEWGKPPADQFQPSAGPNRGDIPNPEHDVCVKALGIKRKVLDPSLQPRGDLNGGALTRKEADTNPLGNEAFLLCPVALTGCFVSHY